MLQFLEKKLGTTIHTFFIFGLICLILGFLVIISEFLWRFFMSILFLIVAFAMLHLAYRLQLFREHMHHFFGIHNTSEEPPARKRTVHAKKQTRVL